MDLKPPATGIECRTGGTTGDHTVVVSFGLPVTAAGNGTVKAQVTSGTGQIGSAGTANGNAITVNGAVVTVPLTNVANAQRLTISLFGVSDGIRTGNVSATMGVLLGDTNEDSNVDGTDASQTKSKSGSSAAAPANTFREDVNCDGFVDGTDVSYVKSRSGGHIPTP